MVALGDDGSDGAQAPRSAQHAPRWKRLWVVLCSRFPGARLDPPTASVEEAPRRRLGRLAVACIAVAVAVILAGSTVGSLIGAAAVGVMQLMSDEPPLVITGPPVEPR